MLLGFQNELRDLVYSLGQNILIDSDLEDTANVVETEITEGIAGLADKK